MWLACQLRFNKQQRCAEMPNHVKTVKPFPSLHVIDAAIREGYIHRWNSSRGWHPTECHSPGHERQHSLFWTAYWQHQWGKQKRYAPTLNTYFSFSLLLRSSGSSYYHGGGFEYFARFLYVIMIIIIIIMIFVIAIEPQPCKMQSWNITHVCLRSEWRLSLKMGVIRGSRKCHWKIWRCCWCDPIIIML